MRLWQELEAKEEKNDQGGHTIHCKVPYCFIFISFQSKYETRFNGGLVGGSKAYLSHVNSWLR